MTAEALTDAQELRQSVERRVDTGIHAPEQVAQQIQAWVAETALLNDELST